MRARRAVAVLAAAAGLAILAAAAFGLHEARSRPIVRQATVALPGWPAGARPLRAVLVSDIHLGNLAMDRRRLHAVVAEIDAARPDLVLIAGDFVVGSGPEGAQAEADALTAPLSRLRAPLGVIAV